MIELASAHAVDHDFREALAQTALRIDEIIQRERIVNWTANLDVQNRMQIDIEDALHDFKSETGMDLSFDEIDSILEKCLDIARRRYGQ